MFWIQCPSYYVPTSGGTAAAIRFATEGGEPAKRLPNGALIPAKRPTVLAITRYVDAISPQFAAVVNRMPQGCSVTTYSRAQGTYYVQDFYSGYTGVFLLSITSGTADETLRFSIETITSTIHK